MKRFLAMLSAVLLTLAMSSGPAVADQHDPDHGIPEHPHVMLLNFEILEGEDTPTPEDDVVTFDKCIDLADSRTLPLVAHHHSLHTGTAGFGNPDVGITKAGHVVVPLAPFPGGLPFEDCAALEQVFPNA